MTGVQTCALPILDKRISEFILMNTYLSLPDILLSIVPPSSSLSNDQIFGVKKEMVTTMVDIAV